MKEKFDDEEENENDKNPSNNIKDRKTSSASLNTSENTEQSPQSQEKKGEITLEDINEILGVDNHKENKEEISEKTNRNLSQDEILDKEIEKIKKKNLSKYLMVDNQFKNPESDIELDNTKEYYLKPKKRQCCKIVGKTLFVFLDKYENPLLIIGPHWGMYVCFCGIITILMFAMYFTFWNKLNLLLRILGHISFWTYFLSYTHCSLINPGYPKNNIGRNLGYPRGDYILCTLCNFYIKKSHYSHHCMDCDICIENYDHHCPWTGHCIGKNNLYSFYIFVGSSFFIIIYIFIAGSIGISQMSMK